jgi:oligopeptide/dipeptide ABC transporter ATP-binding protein
LIRLLKGLQREKNLTYLFISHDLSVIRHVCDRVAVMYGGRLVEVAEADELFARPQHPYTVALLSAVPVPDPEAERRRVRIRLEGEPPDLTRPVEGCVFRSRCWRPAELAATIEPALLERTHGHWSACHEPENLDLQEEP